MPESIKKLSLREFIPIAMEIGVNFAEITYKCSAFGFIDSTTDYSGNEIKLIKSFKHKYLKEPQPWESRYFVLALMNKSYVMYEELEDKILIWVGYTHKSARKQGYISQILKHLTELYQDRQIIGDTFDQSLIKIFESLGIFNHRNRKK